MPWTRDEPDPLKAKRRALAEQEKLLAERMSRLTQELQGDSSTDEERKLVEPPVWREEEEGSQRHTPELTPARRRDLARQRQRDRFIFFLCVVLLLAATAIFFWLWQVHLKLPDPGNP